MVQFMIMLDDYPGPMLLYLDKMLLHLDTNSLL